MKISESTLKRKCRKYLLKRMTIGELPCTAEWIAEIKPMLRAGKQYHYMYEHVMAKYQLKLSMASFRRVLRQNGLQANETIDEGTLLQMVQEETDIHPFTGYRALTTRIRNKYDKNVSQNAVRKVALTMGLSKGGKEAKRVVIPTMI